MVIELVDLPIHSMVIFSSLPPLGDGQLNGCGTWE